MTPTNITPLNVRGLAGWITDKGFLSAFAALVLVVATIYFLKLIFRSSVDRRLEEMYITLTEIKTMIKNLLKEKE